MLFPDLDIAQNRIVNFPTRDSEVLANMWGLLDNENPDLEGLQNKLSSTLRRWQAFRNQIGQKNEHFISAIFSNPNLSNSLRSIINTSKEHYSLEYILNHSEQDIKIMYDWLVRNLFSTDTPARIVTVSKTLLMLTGFSIALDSVVLKLIKRENKYLPCCSGVWPFCLFLECLQFVASEQIKWERDNKIEMKTLLPNVPIGQIMDRMLWTPTNS
jgi:hypothetical protein